MIENLRAIAIFAETIRQGSFRGAAQVLDLSPSAVSYNISELETRLGTALLYRSTRKLAPTNEGGRLFQHAIEMLASAERGIKEISPDDGVLRGKLRISIPAGLTRSAFNRKIADFCQLHPHLRLDIDYTDARQDLITQGIDIAIRAGEMPDSMLKAVRIGNVNRKLVCSPALLNDHKMPISPADLASWDWVLLKMMPAIRVFLHPDHKPTTISIDGKLTVSSVEGMAQMCIMGRGLATPPDYQIKSAIADGDLIELLPKWTVEPISIYAVRHNNTMPNANADRLIKHLQD